MAKIDSMSAGSGRRLKENDQVINIADLIEQIAGGVALTGSNVEVSSAQDTQIATTAKEYLKAAGASQLEVYVESGYIRVRTDGQALHIDYRGTYCRWFWSCMAS